MDSWTHGRQNQTSQGFSSTEFILQNIEASFIHIKAKQNENQTIKNVENQ